MIRVLIIFLMCLFTSFASAIEISPVIKGVWVAVQPEERRFNDCNSLIVEASDFVIVVDAQEDVDDVGQIIEFIRRQTGKSIRYLINTHWHSDHTQGNTIYRKAFGDDLVIIGHTTHTEDIFERAVPALKQRVEDTKSALPAAREQLVTGIKRDGSKFTEEELAAQTKRVEDAEQWVVANENVEFTGPSLKIADAHSVDAGNASFTVIPMRGHTRGDLVVHFPKLGIISTGDLVDAMPYAGHGFPREWLAALHQIRSLSASTYLPGHGMLLGNQDQFELLVFYFNSLTAQVKALLDAGSTPEEIKAAIDLSQSRLMLAGDNERAGRFFDATQEEAIARAIDELLAGD